MVDFNFELYEDGQVERSRDRVHVTLNKECRIFFNARALEALGGPDGVALMYDVRRKAIGVMPSLNRKHAYRLRVKDPRTRGRVITARNFCRHYEIKPEETLEFPEASVNKDGILVLDLHTVKKARRGE
jgi:hypothetical protein